VDITGYVHLGEGVLVGSNATVLPRVRVGAGAIVGAGSTVMRDVPEGATVYCSPARVLAAKEVSHA
jgi:acetyltransferase-like isoleucine patch superfamily enzyme